MWFNSYRTQLLKITLVILSLGFCAPIFAQAPRDGAERILFDSANRERTEMRLRPLRWDNSLATGARQHAERMARENTLSHQLPGEEDFKGRALRAGARFSSLAENIAEGPSAPAIHLQWMHSPSHRENLLDPQLDSIGIAVAERGGEMFSVEDFSLAVADLSFEEQEQQVASLLLAKGLLILNDMHGHSSKEGRAVANEARHACTEESGMSGINRPAFLFRYTTADLDHLPPTLTLQLHTRRYHSAAVGACRSTRKTEFSHYRLAVVLYE